MAKKRVHEIAKERGITSKEALEVLRNAGLQVKVAASSVEEVVAEPVTEPVAESVVDEPPPEEEEES